MPSGDTGEGDTGVEKFSGGDSETGSAEVGGQEYRREAVGGRERGRQGGTNPRTRKADRMKYQVVYEVESDMLLASMEGAVMLPKYLNGVGRVSFIGVAEYDPANSKKCLGCGGAISAGSDRTAWVRNAERLLRRLNWILQNSKSSNQVAHGVSIALAEFHRRPPTPDPEA